jgi:hypothetical protein
MDKYQNVDNSPTESLAVNYRHYVPDEDFDDNNELFIEYIYDYCIEAENAILVKDPKYLYNLQILIEKILKLKKYNLPESEAREVLKEALKIAGICEKILNKKYSRIVIALDFLCFSKTKCIEYFTLKNDLSRLRFQLTKYSIQYFDYIGK